MRFLFAFFLLFLVSNAQSQLLSGEILDDKRKMTAKPDFKIVSGFYEGHVTYELSVDPTGKVTSERFIPEKSTVKSTPANVEAKNYLKSLTFEPGDYYPKYHHVLVRVNFVKQHVPGTKPGTAN